MITVKCDVCGESKDFFKGRYQIGGFRDAGTENFGRMDTGKKCADICLRCFNQLEEATDKLNKELTELRKKRMSAICEELFKERK